MNWDLILAVIFFVVLYGIYFIFKEKFTTQGIFVMYKTKLGLKLMDKISKKDENKKFILITGIVGLLGLVLLILGLIFSNLYLIIIGAMIFGLGIIFVVPLRYISYVGITIGYIGMAFIFYFLIKGVVDMILLPSAPPVVSPVLPGVEVAPGIPILSFWHWIIGILVIATVHEFSHGIYARLHKIKIKSSGFAFIGPLLAAFVEPDEKQMMKKKKREQLSVLMAGPFSNMITGFVFLGIFLIIGGALSGALIPSGFTVTSINQELPIANSTIKIGDNITYIEGVNITDSVNIQRALSEKKSGEVITLSNENQTWQVITSEEKNMTVLGLTFVPYYNNLNLGVQIGQWFLELFFWLWVISFGVGLFNLLPLGPVDGGRMFYLGMFAIFKKKEVAEKIFKAISFISLLLIIINLLPWIIKLFSWIFGF